MPSTVQQSTARDTVLALTQQILTLSSDTVPEDFPPLDPTEDTDTIMRRRTEESFQYALCRRTWWRLTAEERRVITAKVLRENPSFFRHGFGLDDACVGEVRRILEAARQHSPTDHDQG